LLRCDEHHYLPAKEYTFFHLKPLGERVPGEMCAPLREEMKALKHDVKASALHRHMEERYGNRHDARHPSERIEAGMPGEKALIYLFCEQNLLAEICWCSCL
jgi:thymidine kinase